VPPFPELVSFLKEHRQSGAVVEELVDYANKGRVWAVKQDGTSQLIAVVDLGKICHDFGCDSRFGSAVEDPIADDAALSPDKSMIAVFLSPGHPTTSALTGIFPSVTPVAFWQERFSSIGSQLNQPAFIALRQIFSPDGKYAVLPNQGSGSAPMAVYALDPRVTFSSDKGDGNWIGPNLKEGYLKAFSFFGSTSQAVSGAGAWSPDSKGVALRGYDTSKTFLEEYNVQDQKIVLERNDFPPPTTLTSYGTPLEQLIDYLPGSTYVVGRVDGTYAMTLSGDSFTMKTLLPQNIKLVGLIP